MKSINLSIIFLTLAACILARAAETPKSDDAKTTLTKVGDPSPVHSIHTVDDKTVDLNGKVVLLNFFATWCPPCLAEMPELESQLWQPLKDKGLAIIAVGREHSIAEVKAFQKEKKLTFQFAADPKREIYGQFATQYIPRCVLLGKDGKIKFQSMGYGKEDFEALVKAVKAEMSK